MFSLLMSLPQLNTMQAFVARPQAVFAWHKVPATGYVAIALVSQEWKGSNWRHDLVLQRPKSRGLELGSLRTSEAHNSGASRECFLIVTGDRVDAVDLPFGQKLADQSGRPVLTLFSVPNQPLFDRREDAL